MEKFIVSARKYRPQTFDSVVGQQHIVKTLKNAIKTNQLAHAYLFCGPRGVGKTTTARIFAKTINCENITENIEPCNNCNSCRAFNEGKSLNIHELDAASNNSVDDIRNLIDRVRIPPQIGKYSVYIIDEVHMLSQAAFNAFLKTLEEPPEYAIFILATTEKHKILPTILSRCQIFDFNRIKVYDIVEHLKKIAKNEGIFAEEEALNIIAQKADGGLRDALSYFDQIASFSDKNITYKEVIENLNVLDYDYYFKLTDFFVEGDYASALIIFDEILSKGFDDHNFIIGLAEHLRNVLVVKDKVTLKLIEASENLKKRYAEQADKLNVMFLLKALDIINNFDVNFAKAKNKRLHTELMLLKLSQISGELAKKFVPQTQVTQQIVENQEINTPKKQSPEQKQNPSIGSSLAAAKQLVSKFNGQNEKKYSEITVDNILRIWKKTAALFSDRPRIAALFKASTPKIDLPTKTLTIKIFNDNQKQEIEKNISKVRQLFKDTFNTDFNFEYDIAEAPKTTKKLTNEEKLHFLQTKNPSVEKLVKNLNLRLK